MAGQPKWRESSRRLRSRTAADVFGPRGEPIRPMPFHVRVPPPDRRQAELHRRPRSAGIPYIAYDHDGAPGSVIKAPACREATD
jgi:hypothetical protein